MLISSLSTIFSTFSRKKQPQQHSHCLKLPMILLFTAHNSYLLRLTGQSQTCSSKRSFILHDDPYFSPRIFHLCYSLNYLCVFLTIQLWNSDILKYVHVLSVYLYSFTINCISRSGRSNQPQHLLVVNDILGSWYVQQVAVAFWTHRQRQYCCKGSQQANFVFKPAYPRIGLIFICIWWIFTEGWFLGSMSELVLPFFVPLLLLWVTYSWTLKWHPFTS